MSTDTLEKLHEYAKSLSTEAWGIAMVNSQSEPVQNGVQFPGFPGVDIQQSFNGATAQHTMPRAFDFYRLAEKTIFDVYGEVGEDFSVLELGAGWGRICRYFYRLCRPENVLAFDVNKRLPSIWAETMMGAALHLTSPEEAQLRVEKPANFVFAQSLFSHLSEEYATLTFDKMLAATKPGGIVAITSFGRHHIKNWRYMAKKKDKQVRKHLRRLITRYDLDKVEKEYLTKHFVFLETRDEDEITLKGYDFALVHPYFFLKKWAGKVSLLAVYEQPDYAQTLAFFQKLK